MAMNRLEQLFEELPDDSECALITSDVNRRYFTGMKSSDGLVAVFRDKTYLLIDFRYIEKARATVTAAEVIEANLPYKTLSELIKKHGVKKVHVEAETMTLAAFERLKKSVNDVEFDGSELLSAAINRLRTIKDDEELRCIKKAQEIAETAFDAILNFIRPGITEREIALELNRQMLINGAEDISFETIALSGANTSMPHGVPSDKMVCEGEFVLMDFGAVYNGYHSDMTRTVCVGKPTGEMEKVYNTVLEAQLRCLEAAKAGITGEELDAAARAVIDFAGYKDNFGHALGHGVGLEIHEGPIASPRNKEKLKAGSVVTIEPGIYIAGKFGVRIEDFVILTENGCDNLTKCAKNIISL